MVCVIAHVSGSKRHSLPRRMIPIPLVFLFKKGPDELCMYHFLEAIASNYSIGKHFHDFVGTFVFNNYLKSGICITSLKVLHQIVPLLHTSTTS